MPESTKKFIVTTEVTQKITRTYEVTGTEDDTIEEIRELVDGGNVSDLSIVGESEASDVTMVVTTVVDENEALKIQQEKEEEIRMLEEKQEASEPSSGRF